MSIVRNYDTGSTLPGTASETLARESAAAEPTGAVPAYRDAAGVWQYVAPSDIERHVRHLGETVLTVYVGS